MNFLDFTLYFLSSIQSGPYSRGGVLPRIVRILDLLVYGGEDVYVVATLSRLSLER